jgi:hypothetical protein
MNPRACLVVALLVLGVTAAPASALTAKQARAVAVKELRPSKAKGAVALFAAPGALAARTVVSEGGVEGKLVDGKKTRLILFAYRQAITARH